MIETAIMVFFLPVYREFFYRAGFLGGLGRIYHCYGFQSLKNLATFLMLIALTDETEVIKAEEI